MTENTKKIGDLGEKLSAKYLKKHGYRIVSRNSHYSHNELDIIAVDKHFIVFVEVKTRSVENDLYSHLGSAASAVDHQKQIRTINAARSFLASSKHSNKQPRFDVIEVYLSKSDLKLLKINHIENAFGIR